ncbi:hypothetical protein C8F04DRAFT_1185540 [Mycena alexandri]|uniref:Uncharacterized protein n=1 Tax=Mycena alexandri TaxID=1745969 RepID=A0AAD6X0A0_9AGAR|nr:hypothetical protein C8F04DRAFT_1185540 [Mycena alexandri]
MTNKRAGLSQKKGMEGREEQTAHVSVLVHRAPCSTYINPASSPGAHHINVVGRRNSAPSGRETDKTVMATPRAHELPSIGCLHRLHSLLPFLSGAKSASETPPHTPPIEHPKETPAGRKPPQTQLHPLDPGKGKGKTLPPSNLWQNTVHLPQEQAREVIGHVTRTAAGGR